MNFEKQVLALVGQTLKQDDTASFTHGTLFVPEITPRQAAQLETALIKNLKCGIIVSKISHEYAFDFVA